PAEAVPVAGMTSDEPAPSHKPEKTPVLSPEEQAEEPALDHLRTVYRKQRYIKGSLNEFATALASVHVENMSREGHEEEAEPAPEETPDTDKKPKRNRKKVPSNVTDLTAALSDVSRQNTAN
ncbi:hypothetical protein, partial [Haematobacter genomosp. 1]